MSSFCFCQIDRFLKKVRVDEKGCWVWTGFLNPRGYARIWHGTGKQAHRFIFEYFYGYLVPSLEIDHLCRNKACVNPRHLELVTSAENLKRSMPYRQDLPKLTHCRRGHEFSKANTYWFRGYRYCIQCRDNYKKSHPASLRRIK